MWELWFLASVIGVLYFIVGNLIELIEVEERKIYAIQTRTKSNSNDIDDILDDIDDILASIKEEDRHV